MYQRMRFSNYIKDGAADISIYLLQNKKRVLWKKCLFRSFAHFLIALFGFLLLSTLYSLNINPLSAIWFTTTFSHSIGCLCIVLIISLLGRSFLIWYNPTYWFLFCCCAFVLMTKNSLPRPMSKNFFLCFFSGSLTVASVTFKSLTHFHFTFMSDKRYATFATFYESIIISK